MAMASSFFSSAFFVVVLSLIQSPPSVQAEGGRSGCSAPPLLPNSNKPFVVVWNHPTFLCEDKGIHLDFERWGIVDNARDRFFGQQIALFYDLGKWPYYNKQNQPVNGGIPQLSDLQAHLTKVDNDINTHVWNRTFSGLGVIDMEQWRPLYWTNFGSKSIYKRKSLALAEQRFPQYNQSQVLAEAIKEFNKAARDFMGQTLLKTTTKRPNGKWGYYLFPRCFDSTCNTTTIKNNDRISWLFENSTGLYPSIYFKLSTPSSSSALHIKQTLHEAFRVKAKYSSQDIPVMPYSKSQEGPYKMYQIMNLSLAVLQPANMGSSGVVIWGSSSDLRSKNECLILQEYINNVFGPYSRNVTNFFGNCTDQLCQGNGRCVRKDYERNYQQHLRESGRSECLISDDLLASTKNERSEDIDHELPVKNTHINKGTEDDNYDKDSVGKNNGLSFMDSVEKSFNLNLKWQKSHKVLSSKSETEKMSMKSSQSVVSFSIKSYKQRKQRSDLDSFYFSEEGMKNDEKSTSDVGEPDYDFDDFVCKCYPGYKGDHCEINI